MLSEAIALSIHRFSNASLLTVDHLHCFENRRQIPFCRIARLLRSYVLLLLRNICFKAMRFARSFLIFHQALEKLSIVPLWSLCFGKGIVISTSAKIVVWGRKRRKQTPTGWLLGVVQMDTRCFREEVTKERASKLRLQRRHYARRERRLLDAALWNPVHLLILSELETNF